MYCHLFTYWELNSRTVYVLGVQFTQSFVYVLGVKFTFCHLFTSSKHIKQKTRLSI